MSRVTYLILLSTESLSRITSRSILRDVIRADRRFPPGDEAGGTRSILNSYRVDGDVNVLFSLLRLFIRKKEILSFNHLYNSTNLSRGELDSKFVQESDIKIKIKIVRILRLYLLSRLQELNARLTDTLISLLRSSLVIAQRKIAGSS